MGKLQAGSSALVSAALNPTTLAVGVVSVALSELGRRQQEAAQKAAAHKAEVQSLTQALQQDGGAIGQVTNQTPTAFRRPCPRCGGTPTRSVTRARRSHGA